MSAQEAVAMTRHVVAYILHDPVANMEGYITDFAEDNLSGAEDRGLVIIAEYNDGSREAVKAADVKPPEPELNGVKVVMPGYVDVRTDATIAVFDALAAIVNPETAAMSADGAPAEQADPAAAFAAALAKLKALAAEGGGDE